MFKKSGRIILFSIIFSLLFIGTVFGQNQNVYIEIGLEKNRIMQDQPFQVTFTLFSKNEADYVPVWKLNNFDTEFQMMVPNHSRQITIINGKKTVKNNTRYGYSYYLVGKKKGRFNIQGPEFVIDGVKYRPKNLVVDITGIEKNPYYSLSISDIKNSAYVGERVDVDIMLNFSQKIEHLAFKIQDLENKNNIIFNRYKIDNPIAVKLNDTMVDCKLIETDNGNILKIPLSIVIREPGKYNFKETRAGFKGVIPGASADWFGRPQLEEVLIPAENSNQTLVVKSLPKVGKPDNFSGLIGNIELLVSATPVELMAGDPISFKMVLKGLSDYSLDLPLLTDYKEFNSNFRIPKTRSPGKIINGDKLFIQTIRPLNNDVNIIPSFSISFFNTQIEKYELYTTQEIEIKVKKAVIVDEEQVIYNSTAGRDLAISYSDSRQFHNLTIEDFKEKNSKIIFIVIIILSNFISLIFLALIILIKSGMIQKIKKRTTSNFVLLMNKEIPLILKEKNEDKQKLMILEFRNSVATLNRLEKSRGGNKLLKVLDSILFSKSRIKISKQIDKLEQFRSNFKNEEPSYEN